MLRIKDNPVGVDLEIQKLQEYLYNLLTNSGWGDYESYGRVYKNPRDGKLVPEYYLGDKEYQEVLYDDTFSATSFFVVSDEVNVDDRVNTQTISLIYQVNLDDVYPLVDHRADQELMNQLSVLINSSPYGYRITKKITGIDNVYREFKRDNIRFTDMQDFHVMRIDIEVTYSDSCSSSFFFDNVDNPLIGFQTVLSEHLLVFSKEKKATNVYLQNGNLYTNEVPISLPFNTVLLGVYAYGKESQSWSGVVRVDGVDLESVDVPNDKKAFKDKLNLFIGKQKDITVYCEGTQIETPKIIIHLKKV